MTTTPSKLTHKITTETAEITVNKTVDAFNEPSEAIWLTSDEARMTFTLTHYQQRDTFGASMFLYGDRPPRFFISDTDESPIMLHLDTGGSSFVVYLHCTAEELAAAFVEARMDAAQRASVGQ